MSMQIKDIVNLNQEFKNAINLYLHLNKLDKIRSYIPTQSSVNILAKYLKAVDLNTNQSTLLIGPYGKGKSHLILILLAILSLPYSEENNGVIAELIAKISKVDSNLAALIEELRTKDKFLPVIISSSTNDLNQVFMTAINKALRDANLENIMPTTYFEYALETISNWEHNYILTYQMFESMLKEKSINIANFKNHLESYNVEALTLFKELYPQLTSGSTFNPLVSNNVVEMYRSIANTLQEQCGYSGIYIVFDEFSKFIEMQDKKSASQNMKVLQDLCELANDSKDAKVFLTMVAHKSIKEYGDSLPSTVINAFTGIEGRIEEVLFVTSSKNNYELIQNAINVNKTKLNKVDELKDYLNNYDEYYELPMFSSLFTKEDFQKNIVQGCYPLTPLATYALLNISEKIAQNERTLFTFMLKEEEFSMATYTKYRKATDLINVDLIYDYFKSIIKKDIGNVRLHEVWQTTENALIKADILSEKQLIKAIAIINIIDNEDEMPCNDNMLSLILGAEVAKQTITSLTNKGILLKRLYDKKYILRTSATTLIGEEIKTRKAVKEPNLVKDLQEINSCKHIIPKQYNANYSITRYFNIEFMQAEDFLGLSDLEVLNDKNVDGKVLALFSVKDYDYTDHIKEKLLNANMPSIVVVYSNVQFTLAEQLREYEILQELKKEEKYNKHETVINELLIMEEDIADTVNKFIETNYLRSNQSLVAYYQDGMIFNNKTSIKKAVDLVCNTVYNRTLVINNELINKREIKTAPIKKARKNIINDILNRVDNTAYLEGTNADSTIYRAVLVNSGYMSNSSEVKDIIETYLKESVNNKTAATELVNKYTQAPYGMRVGVLPILLAYQISLENEEVILYHNGEETTVDADSIIDLCEKPNEYEVLISIPDENAKVYLDKLCGLFNITNSKGIDRNLEIIKVMQRWYRALPQVTKNISRRSVIISEDSMLTEIRKFKKLIVQLTLNPYEMLFNQMPSIFSQDSNLEQTVCNIEKMKLCLDNYYDNLIAYTVDLTKKIFDSSDILHHMLKEWYENQSLKAKNGLAHGNIAAFMEYIKELKEFSDYEVMQKLGYIVTNMHIDSWNEESIEKYKNLLVELKNEIESMQDEVNSDANNLTFMGSTGKLIERYYEPIKDDSVTRTLRNVLEGDLEDFADLSVNTKVSVLLELIEQIIEGGE